MKSLLDPGLVLATTLRQLDEHLPETDDKIR